MPGQDKFDPTIKGGDPTFREIPSEVNAADLIENHRSKSWDHGGVEQDKNLAFPIDRVKELRDMGRIGSLAERHLSFMGSLTAPSRMVRDHLAHAADVLLQEGVDVALLVPV